MATNAVVLMEPCLMRHLDRLFALNLVHFGLYLFWSEAVHQPDSFVDLGQLFSWRVGFADVYLAPFLV
jgi:hypothetical protein